MEFDKILSISGLGGLHQLKSSNKNGFFVEEIGNGKVRFITDISNRVAALENISIYTQDDAIAIAAIFAVMKDSGIEIPKPSSSANELKSYFEQILPDYDEERVYVSDIKKVIKWYHILDGEKVDFAEVAKAQQEAEEQARQAQA